jgi:hypothetical protein
VKGWLNIFFITNRKVCFSFQLMENGVPGPDGCPVHIVAEGGHNIELAFVQNLLTEAAGV